MMHLCAGILIIPLLSLMGAPGQAEVVTDCFCTQQYDPVCGVDGKTYGNACEAGCQGVQVKHDGECQHVNRECPPRDEVCPMVIVCGSDGREYSSPCQAKCKNVNWEPKSGGACPIKCDLDCHFDPNCATSACSCPKIAVCEEKRGKTYSGPCEALHSGLGPEDWKEGSCKAAHARRNACGCTLSYKRVKGTTAECMADCGHVTAQADIEVV